MKTRCYSLIFLLTFYCAIGYTAEKIPVAVVFSSGLDIYKQAWNETKGYLIKKGIDLKDAEYLLDKADTKTVISGISSDKTKLVFAVGSAAAKFSKENIKNIPVLVNLVMTLDDYSAPNITGISLNIPNDLKLQAIKKTLPDVKRIGVIYSSKSSALFSEIKQAGSNLSLQIVESKAESDQEFFAAFNKIVANIDCFLMIPDTSLYNSQIIKLLLLEGLKNKLPVIGLSSFHTKAGSAISIEADYKDLGIQTGDMALNIINGSKASDIQPQRPRKIAFTLNAAVFEKLGKTIPSGVKNEASEVFGN